MSLVKPEKNQTMPYTVGENIFKLDYKINLKSVLNVDSIRSLTGGVMMNDGRLVLCLFDQKRLLICSILGLKKDIIQLKGEPWDVAAVNNFTVAVLLQWNNCIVMYDIDKKNILKSIPVPGECYGITTIYEKLVVGCKDLTLLEIDLQKGEVVKRLQTDCKPYSVHATGDRIFYSEYISNNPILYCYSYTDDKVTTTTLPSPAVGITSLQDGSLYVICDDGSVQHVSSDGQQYKPVNMDGLREYSDISYNPYQRQLMTLHDYTVRVFRMINEPPYQKIIDTGLHLVHLGKSSFRKFFG